MQIDSTHLVAQNITAGDPGRYAINGVKLERDGTLVATNGRALLLVQGMDQDDGCENPIPDDGVVMPAKFVAQLQKALRGGGRNARRICLVEEATAECLRVRTMNGSVTIHEDRPVEGNFPNYRDIPPAIERGVVRVTFSAHLLADLLDTISSMMSPEETAVELFITPGWIRKNAPILIRAKAATGGRIAAVLMPVTVRNDTPGNEPDSLTEWEREHGLKDKREDMSEGTNGVVYTRKDLTTKAKTMCLEAGVEYLDWELTTNGKLMSLRAFYKDADGERQVTESVEII